MEPKKEETFKERIIKIYEQLDQLDVDEINEEIEKIKKDLEMTIKACEETEMEKEQIIIEDLENSKKVRTAIAVRERNDKDFILIEKGDDNNKLSLKDIVIISLLSVTIFLLIIAMILIVSLG